MPNMKISEVKDIINSRLNDARDENKNVGERLAAMAEAYAYWYLLNVANVMNLENNNDGPNNVQNAQTVNIDANNLERRKNHALNSDAFNIALNNQRVDELTSRPIGSIDTHIDNVKENIKQYRAGDENSLNRAQSVRRQFENTWRIKRNSNEFNAAKHAMRDIAESESHQLRKRIILQLKL